MGKKKKAPKATTPEIPTAPGLSVRNAEIRRVRVRDILDNPLNFRTHDDMQVQSFEATVGELGWYGYPDVFEHPDHPGKVMLVDGELRSHHLAKHYGADAAIDVNVTDFSPAEADKALATKDPIAAMAGVDLAKEADLLRGLEAQTEGFAGLIERLAEQERIDLDPLPADLWDDPLWVQPSDEITAKWAVTPGDIYDLEGPDGQWATVACGDSSSAIAVQATVNGHTAPFMLTTTASGIGTGTAYRLPEAPVAYVWYNADADVAEIVRQLHAAKYEIRAQLIWRRPGDKRRGQHYAGHHETCLYAVRTGHSASWNGSRTESTIWEPEVVVEPGGKPLAVVARPMINHGGATDPIYDPYAGIGQSVLAAWRLKRRSYALDPDPANVAVILERLEREDAVPQAQRRIPNDPAT